MSYQTQALEPRFQKEQTVYYLGESHLRMIIKKPILKSKGFYYAIEHVPALGTEQEKRIEIREDLLRANPF